VQKKKDPGKEPVVVPCYAKGKKDIIPLYSSSGLNKCGVHRVLRTYKPERHQQAHSRNQAAQATALAGDMTSHPLYGRLQSRLPKPLLRMASHGMS